MRAQLELAGTAPHAFSKDRTEPSGLPFAPASAFEYLKYPGRTAVRGITETLFRCHY